MRLLAALLCVGLASCVSVTQRTHDVALHIQINDDTSCSGTIIGPHALIGAAHCFEWPYTIKVYGQPVAVKRVITDGHDHIILVVDRTFPNWARISPHWVNAGDPVTMFGNPGDFTDLFRHGYAAGIEDVGGGLVQIYQLPVFEGDSGSGLFDSHGELIGVVSFMYVYADGSYRIQFAGAWKLEFSPGQLAGVTR